METTSTVEAKDHVSTSTTPSLKDSGSISGSDEGTRRTFSTSNSGAMTDFEKAAKTKKRKQTIGAVAGVVVGLWAIHFAYVAFSYESTDDAQVAAHTSILAARVGGIVTDVKVDENYVVKAGDVLAKIDARDYDNAVHQAEGDLGSVQAREHDAEKTFHRMKGLFEKDAISQQQMDDAEASFNEAYRKLAGVQAQVDQAKLNLSYTEIKAPSDGKMGKKSLEPGMVVTPGQMLFTFVDTRDRWVIANFKETQLRKMKIGQEVELEVDAVGEKSFTGKVDSFSPASGATFALIPPDNATGNYTKIVQRVPVKIVFDKESIKGFEDRIVPGLSAIVTVRVR